MRKYGLLIIALLAATSSSFDVSAAGAEAEGASGANPIQFHYHVVGGSKGMVSVSAIDSDKITVRDIKDALEDEINTPSAGFNIILGDKKLEDDDTFTRFTTVIVVKEPASTLVKPVISRARVAAEVKTEDTGDAAAAALAGAAGTRAGAEQAMHQASGRTASTPDNRRRRRRRRRRRGDGSSDAAARAFASAADPSLLVAAPPRTVAAATIPATAGRGSAAGGSSYRSGGTLTLAALTAAAGTYMTRRVYQNRKKHLVKKYDLGNLTRLQDKVWRAIVPARFGVTRFLNGLVRSNPDASLTDFTGSNPRALAEFYFGKAPTDAQLNQFIKRFFPGR